MRGERGQSTVEAAVLLPVIVLVIAAVVQVLAAGAARERASSAAEAGALAMLQGADPAAAVKDALGAAAERSVVRLDGHEVQVTVRPTAFTAGLGRLLAATSRADAGPRATPVSPTVIRGGDGDGSRPHDEATAGGHLTTETGSR